MDSRSPQNSSVDAGPPRLPGARAQAVALDLPRRRPGQLGGEMDPARELVRGEMLLAKRLQLRGQPLGRGDAVAEYDPCFRLDEAARIRDADHRGLEHLRMRD